MRLRLRVCRSTNSNNSSKTNKSSNSSSNNSSSNKIVVSMIIWGFRDGKAWQRHPKISTFLDYEEVVLKRFKQLRLEGLGFRCRCDSVCEHI